MHGGPFSLLLGGKGSPVGHRSKEKENRRGGERGKNSPLAPFVARPLLTKGEEGSGEGGSLGVEGKVGAESYPLLSGGRRVACSTLSLLHSTPFHTPFSIFRPRMCITTTTLRRRTAEAEAAEAAAADKGEEEESYALLFQTVWVGAPIAIVRSHAPPALLLLPSSFSISSFFPFFPWLLGGERGGERGGGGRGGGAHPFLPPKLSLKWLLPALPSSPRLLPHSLSHKISRKQSWQADALKSQIEN